MHVPLSITKQFLLGNKKFAATTAANRSFPSVLGVPYWLSIGMGVSWRS